MSEKTAQDLMMIPVNLSPVFCFTGSDFNCSLIMDVFRVRTLNVNERSKEMGTRIWHSTEEGYYVLFLQKVHSDGGSEEATGRKSGEVTLSHNTPIAPSMTA